METSFPQVVLNFADMIYDFTNEKYIITVIFLPDNRLNKLVEYQVDKVLSISDYLSYKSYVSANGKTFIVISKKEISEFNFNTLVLKFEFYTKGFEDFEKIISSFEKIKWEFDFRKKSDDYILRLLSKVSPQSVVILYALNYIKICINPSR